MILTDTTDGQTVTRKYTTFTLLVGSFLSSMAAASEAQQTPATPSEAAPRPEIVREWLLLDYLWFPGPVDL